MEGATGFRLNGDRMLSIVDDLTYTTEDWATMQSAHRMASEILKRDPATHENADRLARTIMKLFSQGIRDDRRLAVTAADQEALVSCIATKRASFR